MSPDEYGGHYSSACPPPPPPAPPPPHPFSFHLLEVTLISAQDLFPASRAMRTYAVAWVHSDHPLRTRIDPSGHADPTWNDKFVFRVDDSTLSSDTSAIHVDIYSARPASSLAPTPSSAPHGILNVGVSLVDDSNVSLYADLPAFAFHDLIARKTAQSPAALLEGTGSAEETAASDKKLKKWRSEIRASEEHRASLMLSPSPSTDDEGNASRRGKQRKPRAMSCFNLAGMYADVADYEECSSTSSRSSAAGR
ncbi:hypothetical protein HPP92_022172 [Vanilla planifolia]|uniref:C2 domain-containing protein n=1 Tax=Vanilla planifolia TaxID=51239 RepID=A0A835PWU5_VANPL|nr:hypothetical protein HPP92_022172 [Vanilla planifolia]